MRSTEHRKLFRGKTSACVQYSQIPLEKANKAEKATQAKNSWSGRGSRGAGGGEKNLVIFSPLGIDCGGGFCCFCGERVRVPA